jgi:hypothetical protein
MPAELLMAVVVVAFDGRVLEGSVHPFDLTVGPGMVDLGEAVLDVVLAAAHGEHVCHRASPRAGGVARRITELDAVVGQDRVDLVRHGCDQGQTNRMRPPTLCGKILNGGSVQLNLLGKSWTHDSYLHLSV